MPQQKISFEDAALARAERIVSNLAAADLDLAAEYAALAKSYRSLTRKLEESMGGKLSFSSEQGRTTFRIQLARGNTA